MRLKEKLNALQGEVKESQRRRCKNSGEGVDIDYIE